MGDQRSSGPVTIWRHHWAELRFHGNSLLPWFPAKVLYSSNVPLITVFNFQDATDIDTNSNKNNRFKALFHLLDFKMVAATLVNVVYS